MCALTHNLPYFLSFNFKRKMLKEHKLFTIKTSFCINPMSLNIIAIDVSEYDAKNIMYTMGFRGCNFKYWKHCFNLTNIWWNQEENKIFLCTNPESKIIAAQSAVNNTLRKFQHMGNLLTNFPEKYTWCPIEEQWIVS